MNGSRSVRALVGTLTAYGIARTLILWWPATIETIVPAAEAAAPEPAEIRAVGPPPPRPARNASSAARGSTVPPRTRGPSSVLKPASRILPKPAPIPTSAAPAPTPSAAPPTNAVTAATAATTPPTRSRWSGYAYIFHRANAAPDPLAPGGQIGGAQAAARIAYRLDGSGRLAAAARIATALHDRRQAEAAAGIDLLPLPGLRVSVERRVTLGSQGRNAWSAYVAGGLFRRIAPRVELDGYAQAGVVGARARDPFADAALRIAHRTALTSATDLRLGVGAWGAAQPGATRVDVGPRAAVTLRTRRLPITLAIEGRLRIAGDARPGNGAALTLGTDF